MRPRPVPPEWLAPLLLLSVLSCRGERPAWGGAPTSRFEVVQSWPHDTEAFTEGLLYQEGRLYEGTGLRGRSDIREVELETGQVVRSKELARQYFGEGLALFDGKLYQLTWNTHVGFIYDAATFQEVGRFEYPTEGWGLTTDGTSLIMSDGTPTLHFLDPSTLQEQRTLRVTDNGRAVSSLNELEYIHGEVYANVWKSDLLARIDPETGHVNGWIDLSGLLPSGQRSGDEDVLNGIAYDAAHDRLLVTGKFWPRLFHIHVVPP